MVKCEHCKDEFEHYDTVCINHGIEGKEFRICYGCKDEAVNSGKIIQCDACGEYFTPDVLHDEEICGHSFTACPACGKDVVDCMTREEFEKEHQPCRYTVVVRNVDGSQRGYVVSVDSSAGINGVVQKLAGKVNLDHAASIIIAEILTGEDEF